MGWERYGAERGDVVGARSPTVCVAMNSPMTNLTMTDEVRQVRFMPRKDVPREATSPAMAA